MALKTFLLNDAARFHFLFHWFLHFLKQSRDCLLPNAGSALFLLRYEELDNT